MTSCVRYPALAVYGAWLRVADGTACRGRALARSRRRGNLDDPALGWQRHDRALDRHPAGAHDAGRCRAGAGRRRSGARSAPPGSGWIPTRSCRGVAHALLGATERAMDDLTAAVETGLARGAVEDVFAAQAQLALLAAERGSLGRGRATRTGGTSARRREGLGDYSRARSRMWRRRASHSTRARREDAHAALTARTVCGRCSIMAFRG